MNRLSLKKRIEPGLPPGTLVHIGKKRLKKVSVDLISYNKEILTEKKVEDIDSLKNVIGEGMVSWININGLHDADRIKNTGEVFSIDPLVLEDIMNTDQRPKVEFFNDQVFIVLKMIGKGEGIENGIEQVSLLLGKDHVVSFQERKGDVFDPVRNRIRNKLGRIRTMGADYLAYALIDSVVDNYFPVLDTINEGIEDIEVRLNEKPDDSALKQIHSIKRRLIQIRRSIWPMREAINGLLRDENTLMSDEIKPYLRDVYDHTIQVMDSLDSLRDMASGLMDLYISLVSNKMNEIMKVLTIIATIFIPLTFIAGIYGMNFQPDSSPLNMPELEWYYGYPTIIVLMVVVALMMLIYFKRKQWI